MSSTMMTLPMERSSTSTLTMDGDSLLSWCTTERQAFERGELVFRPGRMQWPFVIVSGALRIDPPAGDDSLLQLALPGDLLCYEPWLGLPQGSYGRAIVNTVVAPVGVAPGAWQHTCWLRQLAASHRRAAEQARLRFGAASERIRALLLLLARPSDTASVTVDLGAQRCELPRLTDIAALTDTTPETASRVLSSLRRGGWIVADGDDNARSVHIGALMNLRAGEMPAGMTRSRVHPPRAAA